MRVAVPYAESLRSRPGLLGILLYGSLVRGSLTAFSDIDLALFYEGEPPHGIERRVVDGVKVDLIAFPLADATKLLDPLPRSLNVGFPFSYVLESLLVAGDDGILYDPTGELLRVKTRLGEGLSFHALNRVSLAEGYHQFYRVNLAAARSLIEQGDPTGALAKVEWSGGALAFLLRVHTILKETREAAEREGIPEFADKREELASIMAPPDNAVEAVWEATRDLWTHAMQAAAEPVKECLRAGGVTEPDLLELAGNYDLFWSGDSLNELGRAMGEVDDSLRRSRHDLDHGQGEEALRHLWGCRGAQGIRHRWERLSAALKETGYDCSGVIDPMLEHAEFARLGERLDTAMKAVEPKEATPEAVQQALALTEEMEGILTGVIPFMSEEELAEWRPSSPER